MVSKDFASRVNDIVRYSRGVNTVVVMVAFIGYGLAFFAWTQEQQLGALVIATMGYVLFRSLRKISYNLTWQAFAQREGYAELMRHIDADLLMLKGDKLAEALAQNIEREKTENE